MSFLGLFHKPSPKPVTLEELRTKEKFLKLKSIELRKDVEKAEREIQALFERSKSAKSRTEEIALANSIKTLGSKKEMKLAAQAQVEKELAAVTSLIIATEQGESRV